MIEAIVTDIEGTTSSLSFVKDVLFPYANSKLADFVTQRAQTPQIQEILHEVRKIENAPDMTVQECIAVLLNWAANDKKIGPLKTLQGMIWEDGYKQGVLKGHIYEDAATTLKQWHAAHIPLYVYSSGSILAQKLLFGHTTYGDLTPLFLDYFDTGIGGKLESDSYMHIATKLNKKPEHILFLSDHVGELNAAWSAGFSTVLLDRDGNTTDDGSHPKISDFNSPILKGMMQ
ncbi:MAG: acireductone synthase [Alphaproteobacteria bacterium]